MIAINKGQANTINVTVTDLTTLSPVYYLFEFINDSTNKKTYCIAANTSTYKERYDRFVITETSSPNPLNGEVSLKKGDYKYNVYEQSSPTNLDPTGLNCVEPGIMECSDTPTEDVKYSGTSLENEAYK